MGDIIKIYLHYNEHDEYSQIFITLEGPYQQK